MKSLSRVWVNLNLNAPKWPASLKVPTPSRVEHVGKISICHLVPPSGVQSLQGLQGTSRVHFGPEQTNEQSGFPTAPLSFVSNPCRSPGGVRLGGHYLHNNYAKQKRTQGWGGFIPGEWGIFNFKVATWNALYSVSVSDSDSISNPFKFSLESRKLRQMRKCSCRRIDSLRSSSRLHKRFRIDCPWRRAQPRPPPVTTSIHHPGRSASISLNGS